MPEKKSKHKQFICLNGEMSPAAEPSLMHNNRAFSYGDALFETIHANGTRLQFFDDHYKRLIKGIQILRMDRESLPGKEHLEKIIIKLLNKNHLYNGVRIRLTVFRDTGGYYTPGRESCSFLTEAVSLPCDRYMLNKKGLTTGLFTSLLKQADSLSNLKTANSLIYVMAGLYKKEAVLDECFILNTKERIAESISSNIFIMKNGILFTPSLSEGCVEGVMRRQIIRIAQKEGIDCIETGIVKEDLLKAEECFLTNSITGISWVVAYGQKRYYSKTARKLITSLNMEQFGINFC